MRQPDVRILSLSAPAEDRGWLKTIPPPAGWEVTSCPSLAAALPELARGDVAIVLCDCDSMPDIWRTLLSECHRLRRPPCVILASRLADERLWAEALNLGAYDVLAKPFDSREVAHALNRAIQHWYTPVPVPVESALRHRAGIAAA